MRLPGLLAGRKDFRHGPSSLDFDGGEDGGGGGEADPDPEATFFTELWQQKRLLPEELESRTGYSTQAGSDDNQSIAMRMAA